MPFSRLVQSVILAAALGNAVYAAPQLVLSDNGKSDYQVVLPEASLSPEVAEWLAQTGRLIRDAFKINGAEVAVVSEAMRDPAKPAIFLGDTQFARANGVAVARLPA